MTEELFLGGKGLQTFVVRVRDGTFKIYGCPAMLKLSLVETNALYLIIHGEEETPTISFIYKWLSYHGSSSTVLDSLWKRMSYSEKMKAYTGNNDWMSSIVDDLSTSTENHDAFVADFIPKMVSSLTEHFFFSDNEFINVLFLSRGKISPSLVSAKYIETTLEEMRPFISLTEPTVIAYLDGRVVMLTITIAEEKGNIGLVGDNGATYTVHVDGSWFDATGSKIKTPMMYRRKNGRFGHKRKIRSLIPILENSTRVGRRFLVGRQKVSMYGYPFVMKKNSPMIKDLSEFAEIEILFDGIEVNMEAFRHVWYFLNGMEYDISRLLSRRMFSEYFQSVIYSRYFGLYTDDLEYRLLTSMIEMEIHPEDVEDIYPIVMSLTKLFIDVNGVRRIMSRLLYHNPKLIPWIPQGHKRLDIFQLRRGDTIIIWGLTDGEYRGGVQFPIEVYFASLSDNIIACYGGSGEDRIAYLRVKDDQYILIGNGIELSITAVTFLRINPLVRSED